MTVTLQDSNKIKSQSGKTLIHSSSNYQFDGYTVLSKAVANTVDALKITTSVGSATTYTASMGLLSASSLCSNTLAFLSKLVQIIEFSALMEFYNIDFDPNLGLFLNQLNEATSFNLLALPNNKYSRSVENSIAAPFKGKLSRVKIPPYFVEDMGYPGIAMIVSPKLNFRLSTSFSYLC